MRCLRRGMHTQILCLLRTLKNGLHCVVSQFAHTQARMLDRATHWPRCRSLGKVVAKCAPPPPTSCVPWLGQLWVYMYNHLSNKSHYGPPMYNMGCWHCGHWHPPTKYFNAVATRA